MQWISIIIIIVMKSDVESQITWNYLIIYNTYQLHYKQCLNAKYLFCFFTEFINGNTFSKGYKAHFHICTDVRCQGDSIIIMVVNNLRKENVVLGLQMENTHGSIIFCGSFVYFKHIHMRFTSTFTQNVGLHASQYFLFWGGGCLPFWVLSSDDCISFHITVLCS